VFCLRGKRGSPGTDAHHGGCRASTGPLRSLHDMYISVALQLGLVLPQVHNTSLLKCAALGYSLLLNSVLIIFEMANRDT